MQKFKGTIISNKMQKTVVVLVDALKKHPKYKKYYRVSKKFKAHVEDAVGIQHTVDAQDFLDNKKGEYLIGDEVMIEETRPLSRDKRWRVVNLIKRSSQHETNATQEADAQQSITG